MASEMATNVRQTTSSNDSIPVWENLSKVLRPQNREAEYWWSLTGRHLAALVEAASYPTDRQHEVLLFHYHLTLPYMGPALQSGDDGWRSLLGLDGSPIEYSWKWNTRTCGPSVRYTVEPIGRFPGTNMDPLNQLALRELLNSLANTPPNEHLDFSWSNHFLATLYDHNYSKYMAQRLGTTVQISAEFSTKETSIKTYFFPCKVGQNGLMPMDQWDASLDELEPNNIARAMLRDFLNTSLRGLTPFSIGVDNLANSRLKWYFHTPHTSFASVREIMTLGGRVHGLEGQFSDLKELICSLVSLPTDFPEDEDISPAASWNSSRLATFGDLGKMLSGYLYYFDIAPGASLPEVKVFIPTRFYANDDLTLAKGIMRWMHAHGRGDYCDRYLQMLQHLSTHRRLQDSNGLQAYVSCLFKEGELDITTYLASEAFHPNRLARGERSFGSSMRESTSQVIVI